MDHCCSSGSGGRTVQTLPHHPPMTRTPIITRPPPPPPCVPPPPPNSGFFTIHALECPRRPMLANYSNGPSTHTRLCEWTTAVVRDPGPQGATTARARSAEKLEA